VYRQRAERDACGIGFVADARGRASRAIFESAIEALVRLRHRGAVAADTLTGDGAGLLFPLPTKFFGGLTAIDPEFVGVAMTFVWPPGGLDHRPIVELACKSEGIDVLGWREVPIGLEALGETGRASVPGIEQAILLKPVGVDEGEGERRCIRARKRAEKECREAGIRIYFPSFSFATVTYKAMCVADRLASFYPDLTDEQFAAPFVIFHQRFSTNTLPSWERAQPFRTLCHNGEINTIQGNVNRMRAREGRLGKINLLEEELLRPVIDETGSDSAMLDNVVELLTREGRDVRHVMAMLIPAAWEAMSGTDQEVRDFYRFHACLTEPWDGPAAVIFTDGKRVGARLDRNGLRPMRYLVCEDGLVVAASEVGAVDVGGHGKVQRRKLGPGQMIFLDPQGGGLDEDPVANRLARRRPYGRWLDEYLKPASVGEPEAPVPEDLLKRQVAFGYTKEEFTTVIRPMATTGHEPTSSMGDDTAPAILAQRPRSLYNYFKQRFAQVTNPAIDHLRERSVMSIRTLVGPHDPILWDRPENAAMLELDTFFLFKPLGGYLIDATFPVSEGPKGLRQAIERIAAEAETAARHGSGILVLSDVEVSQERAPVPMLLAVGAVHHRLLRSGHRTRASITVETDEAREVHHFACLLGYGAEAICPRLVLASLADLVDRARLGEAISVAEALMRYRSAVEEGVLKILSKMGISTTDSYRGAQIFDAVGLNQEVIDLCFAGTDSPVGGIGLDEIAEDVLRRHLAAYALPARLESPGYFKHHSKGEYHTTNPAVVDSLHEALDSGDWAAYQRFAALVEDRPATEVRDLLEVMPAGPTIPLEEVEPVESLMKRFSTGAISHGAIGAEAHETLAIAFNMIGGRANTGEGGEDPARFRNERNCKIKQVASGRFGVTPEYCSYAEELQIKIAQGSKPGEGGQLPGHKVTAEIARLRHTQPGVALISPPPHHDIYSIEDLAQLIFDLKQVNPAAGVSVKLVSEVGVGTIAAGVVKALADVVHIAGWDGGTGASPLSSIKNAGLPWEIGLAETQQALRANGLRDRARLRIDGGMKSGRDVMVAALLGADEFAFGTSVLLAEGCIMVRACHRDTCPVGIATQRPDLRAKFAGTPEKVAAYMRFVAEDVRRILSSLGLRSIEEAIGRTDLLKPRRPEGRASLLELGPLLEPDEGPSRFVGSHPIQSPTSDLGDRLFEEAFSAVCGGREVVLHYPITNSDRTVGARLGGAIAHDFGMTPPPGRVTVHFNGQAGQSFGAFLTHGVAFQLTGEANDYVGKGMGGGTIAIAPPPDDAGDPFLAGNTVLYGATGGRLFIAGRAGERFCVRNSGALAVVEGVGDHACEYMTGGTVVVLGPVGWNLGAGMTGGQAYVWDPELSLPARVNPELVNLHRPDEQFQSELIEIIADHAEVTGSPRALYLLENWESEARHFWRVAPKAEVAKIEGAHEGSIASHAAEAQP
jgi:glutamate synthase domain-containing protein 2/glutamate synthase domain-containing protein 1/glutamate synthase domain-containing protein 3